MPTAIGPPRVFISAAEQSADEHAAAFIVAAQAELPGVVFEGLAGPAMQRAGCIAIHDMTTRSAMALAAVRRVPEAWRLLRRLRDMLAGGPYDAAVVVDSPTLNLPIAKICKANGIPVLYYIAPQTWAWAAWRNGRIAKRVDRLACIWPFEADYFRGYGIHATYVGHPTFDHLMAAPADEERIRALRGTATPVITLLPGSRLHVVEEVLPGQLEVIRALATRYRNARFLLAVANPGVRAKIDQLIAGAKLRPAVEILEGASDRAAAIRAADLALVASGTVTLEVAYHGTPMIVMYNGSRLGYQLIGRWLISTRHLSIPNILAQRAIVPEFMPYYRTVDPIIARAIELLATPASMERMRADLRSVVAPIVKTGAASNAARELRDMLSARDEADAGAAAPE